MYDYPVFKILALNDTGAAAGHQGGIVIPAALAPYFPDVSGIISASSPTADVAIDVVLVVGGKQVAREVSRYQHQTWGGTRSPERRLTSNLGPLRNAAVSGDILLFERDLDESRQMRLTLIKQSAPDYPAIAKSIGNSRWGFLHKEPLTNSEIVLGQEAIETTEQQAFILLDETRATKLTSTQRKARSVAFRKRLLSLYDTRCSLTGKVIVTPQGLVNLDAAHIVPVEADGSDDPRNGIILGKDLHWAFDKGLIYFDDLGFASIPNSVRRIDANEGLIAVAGKKLRTPRDSLLSPHVDALRWHREYVSSRWLVGGT